LVSRETQESGEETKMAHKDLEQDLILTQDSRTLVLSNSTKQINVREKIKVDFKNLAQIMKCEISHNF
jgi:hypothetical protein